MLFILMVKLQYLRHLVGKWALRCVRLFGSGFLAN